MPALRTLALAGLAAGAPILHPDIHSVSGAFTRGVDSQPATFDSQHGVNDIDYYTIGNNLNQPAPTGSGLRHLDEQGTQPPTHATWQDYMFQGMSTGIGFAQLGAGTAAGTNDPSTAYSALGQKTFDKFDALNQKGYGSSAPTSTDGGSRRRAQQEAQPANAKGATWQDYMLAGINAGIKFVTAGAGTAAGTVDPSTAFSELGAETATSFDHLNRKGEEQPPSARRRLQADPWADAAPATSAAAAIGPATTGKKHIAEGDPFMRDDGYLGGPMIEKPEHPGFPAAWPQFVGLSVATGAKYTAAGVETGVDWITGGLGQASSNSAANTANRFAELGVNTGGDYGNLVTGGSMGRLLQDAAPAAAPPDSAPDEKKGAFLDGALLLTGHDDLAAIALAGQGHPVLGLMALEMGQDRQQQQGERYEGQQGYNQGYNQGGDYNQDYNRGGDYNQGYNQGDGYSQGYNHGGRWLSASEGEPAAAAAVDTSETPSVETQAVEVAAEGAAAV